MTQAELLFGCEKYRVSVCAVCKSAEANDCRLQCSEIMTGINHIISARNCSAFDFVDSNLARAGNNCAA
jgi:hypothetical protein